MGTSEQTLRRTALTIVCLGAFIYGAAVIALMYGFSILPALSGFAVYQ